MKNNFKKLISYIQRVLVWFYYFACYVLELNLGLHICWVGALTYTSSSPYSFIGLFLKQKFKIHQQVYEKQRNLFEYWV